MIRPSSPLTMLLSRHTRRREFITTPERRWLTSDWVRRCYPGVAPSLTADGLARAAVRKFAPNQGLGCAPKEHPNSRPSGAPVRIKLRTRMLLKLRYNRPPLQVRFPVEVCIVARHATKEVRGGVRRVGTCHNAVLLAASGPTDQRMACPLVRCLPVHSEYKESPGRAGASSFQQRKHLEGI